MNERFIQRRVPEQLNLALEVCLQRYDISPHYWERKMPKSFKFNETMSPSFGDLFCSTTLNDEEWAFYLKLAECEFLRSVSASPGVPVFLRSMLGPTKSKEEHETGQKLKIIEKRLGAKVTQIIEDKEEL